MRLGGKPTLVPAFGSTCVRFSLYLIFPRATLLHQLLVVVKVDPHVVNCLTVPVQDGGLRDKFNPEREEGIRNAMQCNHEIGGGEER